jgi:hypothetical protein
VSCIKFNFDTGSEESTNLLQKLSESGYESQEIFENKLIQKLLDIKFSIVKWLTHVLFLFQLSFLVCILAFPLSDHSEFWMILVYLILFILREIVQIDGYILKGKFTIKSLTDYLGCWNILDIVNIIFMTVFLCFNGDLTEDQDA